MKKTFKLVAMLFAMSAIMPSFTSCSSDDDNDPTVDPTVSYSINGKATESGSQVTLEKGTVNPTEEGSDKVTLNIISDQQIKRVEITVKNSFENNVSVVDENGISHCSNYTESTEEVSKSIEFTGVYGEYNVKVVSNEGSSSYSFKLVDDKGKADYTASTRLLCNKQSIIFDASKKTSNDNYFGQTYKVDKDENTSTLNGEFAILSEDDYNSYSSEMSKIDFENSVKDSTFKEKRNITTVPCFFVCKYNSKYYLMKVNKISGDILTTEIQY